jgi:hypothetical protein
MHFRKAFLDFNYLNTLEQLCIREGLIQQISEDDGAVEPLQEWHRSRERLMLKQQTLRALVLFENVDSNFSIFDWSRLVDAGAVAQDAVMTHSFNRNPELDDLFDIEGIEETLPDEKARLVRYAKSAARKLLFIFRERIIKTHVRRSGPEHYTANDRWGITVSDLHAAYRDCVIAAIGGWSWPGDRIGLTRLTDEIAFTYHSLVKGLYLSGYEEVGFASDFAESSVHGPIVTQDIIDDLYYVVRTRLTDEVLVLPQPQSVRQALEIRDAKEMKSFREVLSRWLRALESGDAALEQAIRGDLKRANQALKKVKYWTQYKNSPVNFWINSVGGQIPGVSNVITGIHTLGDAGKYLVDRKCAWALLVQPQRT